MVRSKTPSGACQNCKTRHIKCDEAHPHCRRCSVASIVCVGYRSPHDRLALAGIQRKGQRVQQRSSYPLLAPSIQYDPLPLACAQTFLVPATSDLTLPSPLVFLSSLGVALQQTGSSSCQILRYALEVFFVCLENIRKGSQCLSDRREAAVKYDLTIQGIRQMLEHGMDANDAHVLVHAVYLVALFEMTVSISRGQETWRYHLSGLNALLSQPTRGSKIDQRRDAPTQYLLYDGLKRFRQISATMDDLLDPSRPLSTIEVRKIRADAKRVRKVFCLIKTMYAKSSKKVQRCEEILILNNACLLLITSFLLKSGHILHHRSKIGWSSTQEFNILHHIRTEVRESIYCSALNRLAMSQNQDATSVPEDILTHLSLETVPRVKPGIIEGILVLYPLYVTLRAADVGSLEYRRTHALLRAVADQCYILKALGMICAEKKEERLSYAEVVDGLLLIFLGFHIS